MAIFTRNLLFEGNLLIKMSQAYLEPCKNSMMEPFTKLVKG